MAGKKKKRTRTDYNDYCDLPVPEVPVCDTDEAPIIDDPVMPPTEENPKHTGGHSEVAGIWEEIPSRTPSHSEADINNTGESEIGKDNDFDPPHAIPTEHSITRCSGIEGTTVTLTDDYTLRIFASPCETAGTRTAQFLVARSVLSMSSTVFKDFITANIISVHAHEQGPRIMLVRTDLTSLHIILRILHFDIEDDLMDIAFEDFVNIAVLCDRYQLHRALRPWVHIWLEKHIKSALDPGYEDWLYISKTFGCRAKLEDLIKLLADECSVISDCGTYILRRGKKVPTKHWPEEILDRILSLRAKEIERLSCLLQVLINFLRHPSEYQKFCQRELCADLAYGSLLRSIEKNELSRILEPGVEWDGSVESFREKLNALRIETINKIDSSHICAIETVKDRFATRITCGGAGRDIDSTGENLLSSVPNLPASQTKHGSKRMTSVAYRDDLDSFEAIFSSAWIRG